MNVTFFEIHTVTHDVCTIENNVNLFYNKLSYITIEFQNYKSTVTRHFSLITILGTKVVVQLCRECAVNSTDVECTHVCTYKL